MGIERWLGLVLMLATAAAGAAASRPATQAGRMDREPNELAGVGITEHLNARIPLDLEFLDEDGRRTQLSRYFQDGKPAILTLVYYSCPMLCNLVLNGMVDGLKGIPLTVGKDFNIVTVSIDPRETKTLARLKKQNYLKEYGRVGAAAGWPFLTGREEDSRKLADAVGFGYRYVPETQQYAHAACIFILTPDGRISRYLYGIQFNPKSLRLGLVEASEGKIGSTMDRVLLFCFHYDPKAGTYSLAAFRISQVVGGVTLLLLGGVMGVFWGREAKRRRAAGGPGSLSSTKP
jgi:protein SCO1